MVRGLIERTELQTLLKGRIVPMEEQLILYLRTFASPDPAEIIVMVQIASDDDYYLCILHKSNGFKKEEIFNIEKYPPELKSMGTRGFDPVMNRMLYISPSLRRRTTVIKALQLDCDGKVIMIHHELNITYVREFKKLKTFAIDQTGNVLIMDYPYKSSAELYRIVPQIY
jgi:hypothetical protein